MNQKSYKAEYEQQLLEAQLDEEEYIADTFQRVIKGENVSEKDLKLVERVKKERGHTGRDVDSAKVLRDIEKGLSERRSVVAKNRKVLKKRRLERDRVRRQRRLQHERRRASGVEREM